MLKLQDYRSKAQGLPDLLTYAALVDEGIILQKNGSFLAGWEIKGQDTASSTPEELEYISLLFSNAVKLLGNGWMLHVDAMRLTEKAYPEAKLSHFPKDAIASQIIDAERRVFFGRDVCFTTSTVLCVTYLPNYNATKLAGVTTVGIASHSGMEKNIEHFKNSIIELEDALSAVLRLSRLKEYEINGLDEQSFTQSDLLSHLQYCLTGKLHTMQVPKVPMYLDAILGSYDLVGGIIPRLDNQHLAIISIDGLPQESWPAMFSALDSMPFEYRFSTRFIGLDQYNAEKEIATYVKGWNQKVLGFMDQFLNNPNAKVNRDALIMREDAEIAKTEIQSGYLGAGYLTSCIIIMHEDIEILHDNARELRRAIQILGFGCRIESINSVEAWLGALPGNSYANLRRPLVNTLNLADLLPLSTIWTGSPTCPSPFFKNNPPALGVVMTENETTPFWLNLHFGDIGHTLIFGPTGSGKSTLLALIASHFRRYKNAHIFVFDKGMSMFPLCLGDNGDHFEIGGKDLAFAPLQEIDSPVEMAFAEEWIASLMELQNVTVLPVHKNNIHAGILLLKEQPKNMRSLSHFSHLVPDSQIKEAIAHYTTAGAMGHLLDAEQDNLSLSPFTVFEMEELMQMGDKNLIPVLTYIFHRIEKSLKGQPALLILDEAWVMLGHPVFREKIREWLKVLRKANCAVVMATQSLSDAKKSGIFDVLAESCPTKICLANPYARQEDQYHLYKDLGLNSRQIEIIATATPKRDYYIFSPEGRRLIQLVLGSNSLSFLGASDKESIKRIKEIHEQYGSHNWQGEWIEERKLS